MPSHRVESLTAVTICDCVPPERRCDPCARGSRGIRPVDSAPPKWFDLSCTQESRRGHRVLISPPQDRGPLSSSIYECICTTENTTRFPRKNRFSTSSGEISIPIFHDMFEADIFHDMFENRRILNFFLGLPQPCLITHGGEPSRGSPGTTCLRGQIFADQGIHALTCNRWFQVSTKHSSILQSIEELLGSYGVPITVQES